jgi:hypothetical protein
MKALALALPLFVLATLLLLQRMEDWCARPSRATRRGPPPPVLIPPAPAPPSARTTMARQTATASPAPAADAADAAEPLLRDPPPPPGYVDPLEEDPLLSDLMEDGGEAPLHSGD